MQFLALVALLYYAHRSFGHAPRQLSKRLSTLNNSLIVGGYDVIINQFPFAAYLSLGYSDNSGSTCGAIILNVKFVLTAGHCFLPEPSNILISVGSTYYLKGKWYHISHYEIHRQFVPGKADYDIGLGKTAVDIVYVRMAVRPAVLAESNTQVPKYSKLTVIGWGKTSEYIDDDSPKLQAMVVPAIDQTRCFAIYRHALWLTERSFCAGHMPGVKGTCHGDSGGAAVNSKGQVVGIIAGNVGCAKRGYPSIFTRVSSFREWIKTYTGV